MKKGSLSGLDFRKRPPVPAIIPSEAILVSVVYVAAPGHDEAWVDVHSVHLCCCLVSWWSPQVVLYWESMLTWGLGVTTCDHVKDHGTCSCPELVSGTDTDKGHLCPRFYQWSPWGCQWSGLPSEVMLTFLRTGGLDQPLSRSHRCCGYRTAVSSHCKTLLSC